MTRSRSALLCAVATAALFATAMLTACEDGGSHQAQLKTASSAGILDTSPAGAHKVGSIGGLHSPESALYDAEQDVWFVSNMAGYGSVKDDIGYIVRVNGGDLGTSSIFAQSGGDVHLDAPKGMTIHGDTLWVADIDILRGFNRRTGQHLVDIDLASRGAVLLNDVAIGPDGRIWITDTGIIMSAKGVLHPGGDKVFVVGPGASVALADSGNAVAWANGIAWDDAHKRFDVVSFDPFKSAVYALGTDSGSKAFHYGKGRFDGLVIDGQSLLVSCWADSSIHQITGDRDIQLVRNVPAPADIGMDARRHRLAIPLPMSDMVEFWDLPGVAGAATRVAAR